MTVEYPDSATGRYNPQRQQEVKNAEQKPSPAPSDGGSGTQPGVREEGGSAPVSSEGVQSEGPASKSSKK